MTTNVAAHHSDDPMKLPEPDPAFHWSRELWGHALRCRALGGVAQHLFTTKQLPLRPFERHPEEWAMAVKAVGGNLQDLKRIRQVHGRTVHVVRPDDPATRHAPPDADAVISNSPGQVLAVQVADCVPLLLADRRTGAIGAVHSGWRGAAAQITSVAVETLVTEFGVRPTELLAAVGPSIGACCYEVGSELVEAFRAAGASDEQLNRWFVRADRSLRLDLWTVTCDQLVAAGVPANQIHVARLCTRTHATVFDSYRAAGPNADRMAALIKVPTQTQDTKDS